MKRHPALIPLSRDHHDGLVQVRPPGNSWSSSGTKSVSIAGSRVGSRLSVGRLTQVFAVLIVGVALFLIAKNVAAFA